MKRKTSFLAASAFVGAATFALSATAQQVAPSGAPPATTPSTPEVAPSAPAETSTSIATGTTTTTAADTTAGAGVAMSPVEPRLEADTVTVDRRLYPNRPVLFTGLILLTATYVPTAAIGATSGREVQDRNLLIPVAGPWMNLADRQCGDCENETRNKALIIGSGVLQGLGAAIGIASIFIPEKIAAATIQAGPMKLQVAPQIGRTGMGLGTVGVF